MTCLRDDTAGGTSCRVEKKVERCTPPAGGSACPVSRPSCLSALATICGDPRFEWKLRGAVTGGTCPIGVVPYFYESRLHLEQTGSNIDGNYGSYFGQVDASGFSIAFVGVLPASGTCGSGGGFLYISGPPLGDLSDVPITQTFNVSFFGTPPPGCPQSCSQVWTGTMSR